jgi:flagellin
MANDTNDIDSRTAAVREIIERIEEIDRLAESTNFNGKKMLDGTAATESIIVQMGADETLESILDISPAMTDCRVDSLGVQLPEELNPDRRQELDVDGVTPIGDIYVKKELLDDDGKLQTVYVPEASEDIADDIGVDAFNALGLSLFNPTNEDCRNYMASIQDAIATLSTNRGLLGAYENRLDSSYDQLSIRIETLEQAKSVYTDTDIAEESTNMTTQQILQQCNVALLANANTIPQLALSLIGG